jgi:hypothetical protein
MLAGTDGPQIDEATVEFIVVREDLLEKAAEVAHDIEERLGQVLGHQTLPKRRAFLLEIALPRQPSTMT